MPGEPRAPSRGSDEEPGAYAIHHATRSAHVIVAVVLMAATFVWATSLDSVSRVLGFGVREAAWATVVFLAGMSAANVVYYTAGVGSRWYRVLESVESLTTTSFVMGLIYVSKNAVSFLWLFHFIHLLVLAAAGLSLSNGMASVVGPAGLALAFAYAGDSASAWLSAVSGFLGFFVYLAFGRVHTDLEQSRRREASLRLALAELRVREERARISRDLHDGVATALTALIWKARELARETSATKVASELEAFERRLSRTLSDLRDVVMSLRASHASFSEAVHELEERCRELAAEKRFSFSLLGELPQDEVERFCREVFPIACELTKNAHAHSQGSEIGVELVIDEQCLSLTVWDDGVGLARERLELSRGGLRNVKRRAQTLGGEVLVSEPGTLASVTVSVPRPLRTRLEREELGDMPEQLQMPPPSGTKRVAS